MKIDLNKYPIFNNAIMVLKTLSDYGEAFIVGGAVRDIITGKKEPNDIDISTNVPMEMIESLFDTHNIGKNKDFGVVVIQYNYEIFEISQYRVDIYDDMITGKGADSVKIVNTFKEDCSRRDFTINSLGMDMNGNIIDNCGGIQDIKNKTIRTVNKPDERFSEDYVRILRGVRFAINMRYIIEQQTYNSMIDNIHNVVKYLNIYWCYIEY
jgi:tRNA nucleotidyltransferase (CCA-adding enzyme)